MTTNYETHTYTYTHKYITKKGEVKYYTSTQQYVANNKFKVFNEDEVANQILDQIKMCFDRYELKALKAKLKDRYFAIKPKDMTALQVTNYYYRQLK
jgi:hypothetical protein